MVCRASPQFLLEKPLFLMGCNILVALIVPISARLAGNNDPNENQISHVFGQGSICVAMDFPGWMEIATIMFFITGLLHSYAMIKVYQHCKSEWEGKNSKRCLAAFVAFQILLVNCFWLVGIFNPVVDHSVDTVFAHSIPYVGLQVCFFFWVIFLLAFVHPTGVGRIRQVSWYLFSAAYVASQIFTLVLIFWTFAELAQPDVETAGPNRFKGPLPREGRILPLSEPVSLIFRLGCFFLHPLRIAAQSEKGEAAKAVTAKTEEV